MFKNFKNFLKNKNSSSKYLVNDININRIKDNITINPTEGLNMADLKLINIYSGTDSITIPGQKNVKNIKTVTENYFNKLNDTDLKTLTNKYKKLYNQFYLNNKLSDITDKKKIEKINENVKNLVSRLAAFDLTYKKMGSNIVDNITFKTEFKKLIDNEEYDLFSSISQGDKNKLKNLIDDNKKKNISFNDLLQTFKNFDNNSMLEITNRIRRIILNEDVSEGEFLRNQLVKLNKISMKKRNRPMIDLEVEVEEEKINTSIWKAHKKKIIALVVVYVIITIIGINKYLKDKEDNNVQVSESNKNSNDESNDESNDDSCKGPLCNTSYDSDYNYDSDYDYDYENNYDSYYGKEEFSNINEEDFKSDFILNFVENELEKLKDTDDDYDEKMEEITKLLIFYLIDSDEINNKINDKVEDIDEKKSNDKNNEKIVEKNFFEKYKYYIIGIVSFIILLVIIILIL